MRFTTTKTALMLLLIVALVRDYAAASDRKKGEKEKESGEESSGESSSRSSDAILRTTEPKPKKDQPTTFGGVEVRPDREEVQKRREQFIKGKDQGQFYIKNPSPDIKITGPVETKSPSKLPTALHSPERQLGGQLTTTGGSNSPPIDMSVVSASVSLGEAAAKHVMPNQQLEVKSKKSRSKSTGNSPSISSDDEKVKEKKSTGSDTGPKKKLFGLIPSPFKGKSSSSADDIRRKTDEPKASPKMTSTSSPSSPSQPVKKPREKPWSETWFPPEVQDIPLPDPDEGGILDKDGVAKYLPGKIVVFGDIHGDIEALKDVLTLTEVAVFDDEGRPKWIGGDNTVVVSLGDIPDRGPESVLLWYTLFDLRDQARSSGKSDVVLLLGNHDIMTLTNHFLMYGPIVSDEDLLKFANVPIEHLRPYAKEEELQLLGELYKDKSSTKVSEELRKVLTKIRQRHFFPNTPLGSKLHAQPVAAQIGPYVFAHAGFTPQYAKMTIRGINQDRFNKEKFKARMMKNGRDPTPDDLDVLNTDNAGDMEGVVWTRKFGAGFPAHSIKSSCKSVATSFEVLSSIEKYPVIMRAFGAHTPTTGLVQDVCEDGRLIAVDTSMSKWMEMKKKWTTGIGAAIIFPSQDEIPTNDFVIGRNRGFADVSFQYKTPKDWTDDSTPMPHWYTTFFNAHDSGALDPRPYYLSKSWAKEAHYTTDPGVLRIDSKPVKAEGFYLDYMYDDPRLEKLAIPSTRRLSLGSIPSGPLHGKSSPRTGESKPQDQSTSMGASSSVQDNVGNGSPQMKKSSKEPKITSTTSLSPSTSRKGDVGAKDMSSKPMPQHPPPPTPTKKSKTPKKETTTGPVSSSDVEPLKQSPKKGDGNGSNDVF